MSTFNNGGGDLNSTNLPSAFLEIAVLLKNAEVQASRASPTLSTTGLITISFKFETSRVEISANIPVTQIITNMGSISTTGVSYVGYPYNQFNPGTGGYLNAKTKADALLQIAELVFNAERLYTAKPTWYTNFSISDSLNTMTTKLPINKLTNPITGDTIIQVIDYLP